MMAKSNMKVIIVGGGIGGLALANCLQHTDIEFVLLERHDELDPQQGASIGILPNGARILDQLGCYDDLSKMTISMETSATHREDGSIIGDISDTLKLMELRSGYPVFFLDRQLLLRALANAMIKKDQILLSRSVKTVEANADKVVVSCSDGTSVEGDILVGADGVYSSIRREMWRHADAAGDGEIFEADKNAMSAEYKCLFGISQSIAGMCPGQTDRTYGKGRSTLSYVGRDGRLFWFVFVKMDKTYYCPNIPKFTENDAAQLVEEIGDFPIREHGTVTVRDLYQARVACNLVAIEEAEYQQWSYGRIVCMGDSAHKMTPNLGAGASSAIESAATLSNVLLPLAKQPCKPSQVLISKALQDYQTLRSPRVGRATKFSNALTRVQALKTAKDYIYTHYVAPRLDDFAAEMFSDFIIGAPLVNHLPVPERSIHGTMPFNPEHGWGNEEPQSVRAKRALPLLALSLVYLFSLLRDYSGFLDSLRNLGRWETHLERTLWMKSNSLDAMYCIWLIEAARLSNKVSILQFPIIFGIASKILGIAFVAPLYLFYLYIKSPIQKFRASDNLLTDISYTSTAGPLLVILGSLPRYMCYYNQQQAGLWAFVLETQPLLLSLCQFLLASFFIPSSVRSDRLQHTRRDMPYIYFSIGLLTIASFIAWANSVAFISLSHHLLSVFWKEVDISFAIAAITWLVLVLVDFRAAGMFDGSVIKMALIGLFIAMVSGPSCLLLIGWLWREHTLLVKKHKDAVTTVEHSPINLSEKFLNSG